MSSRPPTSEFQSTDLHRAHALSAWFYTDAESSVFEKRAVFARHWQLLAHTSQLPEVGDHLVCEIAGIPLLLVRGDDGELRALHNVCRHRAGPLALCDGRGAKALRCRYHGWTYSLAGQLRSAPEMQDAENFDVDSIRLPQVRLGLWRGLVFAAIDPAFDLPQLMQQVESRLGQRDFSRHEFSRRVQYEVACNWKVYVDNYLEGYHLPHIHPALNRLLDYRNYVTETGRWHSLQYSPMRGGENFYGEGEALYYFVWPNIMLNILPDRSQVNRVIPLGVDRCRVEFDYVYPLSDDPQEQARRNEDQRFSDEVQLEDGEICAAVQQRLASGVYQPGRLNPTRESAVHHFHELLRQTWRNA